MQNTNLDYIFNSITQICSTYLPEAKKQYEINHNYFPEKLVQELLKIGLGSLAISENFGGSNLSHLEITKVIQHLASHDLGLSIIFSVHTMCCNLFEKFASEELKLKYLPNLAISKIAAFALTEPQSGSDAKNINSHYIKNSSKNFVLNGEKCYISSAIFADIFIYFAKNSTNEISAFILEKSFANITIASPEQKMGAELSPISSVYLTNVEVPNENLLYQEGKGFSVAMSALASGRVNIAACAIGIMHTALNISSAYLKERKQFNQKLSSFQGLQFLVADMDLKLNASIELVQSAANYFDQINNSLDKKILTIKNYKAALAKCFATDSAMYVTTEAVQLLGGAGYLKAYQVEQLMRDAKMLQIVEGTNQIQRILISQKWLN